MDAQRITRLTLALTALLVFGIGAGASATDNPAAGVPPPPATTSPTSTTTPVQPTDAQAQAPETQTQPAEQPAPAAGMQTQPPETQAPSPDAPNQSPPDAPSQVPGAQPSPSTDASSTQWNKSSATVPVAPSPVPAQTASQQHAPSAAQDHQAPPAIAAKPVATTPKQDAIVAQVANPTDASGFRLMTLSTNALLSRISLADQAQHTIDMQYYIFNNDATGRLIALHVLQAADRGVHVRILLDDLNLVDEVRMFEALDSHPNIEVRLFNPFNSPEPNKVSKIAQFVLEFGKLNRRMHNKCFIVDNDEAVIGGRNIGDGYFNAAADNNFRDLDVLAIGPVVPAATHAFDAYWNSDAVHPISDFQPKADPTADLAALRPQLKKDARSFDQSAYAQEAAADLPKGASADRPGNWYWGPATLVADQPDKIANGSDRPDLRISPELKTLINGAQTEVLLISPYFVPSDKDEENFIADAQRGVAFKVLTNSLASTDEILVHEGYSEHRRALLKGGVQLFELKPGRDNDNPSSDSGRSSGVSLHAKTFVVDQRYVFIGSLNMDQRSKLLNTEMGVIVDSPQLAKAVARFFADAASPKNAYHLVLGDGNGTTAGGIHWQATSDGKPVELDHEPDTSLGRRVKVKLLKLLPMDGLL